MERSRPETAEAEPLDEKPGKKSNSVICLFVLFFIALPWPERCCCRAAALPRGRIPAPVRDNGRTWAHFFLQKKNYFSIGPSFHIGLSGFSFEFGFCGVLSSTS